MCPLLNENSMVKGCSRVQQQFKGILLVFILDLSFISITKSKQLIFFYLAASTSYSSSLVPIAHMRMNKKIAFVLYYFVCIFNCAKILYIMMILDMLCSQAAVAKDSSWMYYDDCYYVVMLDVFFKNNPRTITLAFGIWTVLNITGTFV